MLVFLLISIEKKFNIFIDSISAETISQLITPSPVQQQTGDVVELLATYANEARAALALVGPFLSKDERILEIGAGLCLLSFFLKQEGYDIVALEPATGGFDFFANLQKALSKHFHKIKLQIIHCRAEEITAEKEGWFNLIFSYNVLEHIPNPNKTLNALLGVMEKQGKMIHSCPNYFIPYEPHFRVPLCKIFPEMTKKLFGHRVKYNEAMWDSLNFITYFDVRKFARKHHLLLSFKHELLYQALSRLDNDPLFRQRQGNLLLITLFNFLKRAKLFTLIKHLPPALATPMVFIISRP